MRRSRSRGRREEPAAKRPPRPRRPTTSKNKIKTLRLFFFFSFSFFSFRVTLLLVPPAGLVALAVVVLRTSRGPLVIFVRYKKKIAKVFRGKKKKDKKNRAAPFSLFPRKTTPPPTERKKKPKKLYQVRLLNSRRFLVLHPPHSERNASHLLTRRKMGQKERHKGRGEAAMRRNQLSNRRFGHAALALSFFPPHSPYLRPPRWSL